MILFPERKGHWRFCDIDLVPPDFMLPGLSIPTQMLWINDPGQNVRGDYFGVKTGVEFQPLIDTHGRVIKPTAMTDTMIYELMIQQSQCYRDPNRVQFDPWIEHSRHKVGKNVFGNIDMKTL